MSNMKRNKTRSEISVRNKSTQQFRTEVEAETLDILTIRIRSLRITEENPCLFYLNVSFMNRILMSGHVKATPAKLHLDENKTIAIGTMSYDPSNYEEMCLLANYPLVVKIFPMKNVGSTITCYSTSPTSTDSHSSSKSGTQLKETSEASSCNIDILSLFIDEDKLIVSKRMQPMIRTSILKRKSWCNLPLVTIELSVSRNPANNKYHQVLKKANVFSITLPAAYNMLIPYDEELTYNAATIIPVANEFNTTKVTFSHGLRLHSRFKPLSFYPKWESLRTTDEHFTKGDENFFCNPQILQNEDHLDIHHYLDEGSCYYTTVWGSFHRTLLLENSERWLMKRLRTYNWPLEVHITGETGGFSFMAFLNLFSLLYPGERAVRLAVPLHWINAETMMEKGGCELLQTPCGKAPSNYGASQKCSKATTSSSGPTLTTSTASAIRPTGADDGPAFVIVEVKLRRPLKKPVIPRHITNEDISEMLRNVEQGPSKRECTGRGQLERDWQSTVKSAANSLRRVPYYGRTDFCTFNRQLSETRTRVELSTSCWQEAAIYVNNNFITQDYLQAEDTFEEMLMMAHACLMRSTGDTLAGIDNWRNIDPTLRAARHARQMQDIPHALDLYIQIVAQKPRDANGWRELATCLKDVDMDWANVCINKSVVLDPRNPLSLLSKGCMVMEEDPVAAEPFFIALLAFFPTCPTIWVATSAYYMERELFHMADQILEQVYLTRSTGLTQELPYPRAWEHELGDWWEHTPLLPGMSFFFDAADLLLRLRALNLADICVARALCEVGESAAYYHLVALCCRLRGNVADALCHVQLGLDKYGEITFLRTLEAECYHQLKDCNAAMASFEKAGSCISSYSILLSMPSRDPSRARSVLVDLIRRQPNAYAWMALADDWMLRASVGEGGDAGGTEEQVAGKTCAAASAVQSLKWDRRAGRAWALLAKLVKPKARRLFCMQMVNYCGYDWPEDENLESFSTSQQSLCHRVGVALRECRCMLCEKLKF